MILAIFSLLQFLHCVCVGQYDTCDRVSGPVARLCVSCSFNGEAFPYISLVNAASNATLSSVFPVFLVPTVPKFLVIRKPLPGAVVFLPRSLALAHSSYHSSPPIQSLLSPGS